TTAGRHNAAARRRRVSMSREQLRAAGWGLFWSGLLAVAIFVGAQIPVGESGPYRLGAGRGGGRKRAVGGRRGLWCPSALAAVRASVRSLNVARAGGKGVVQSEIGGWGRRGVDGSW